MNVTRLCMPQQEHHGGARAMATAPGPLLLHALVPSVPRADPPPLTHRQSARPAAASNRRRWRGRGGPASASSSVCRCGRVAACEQTARCGERRPYFTCIHACAEGQESASNSCRSRMEWCGAVREKGAIRCTWWVTNQAAKKKQFLVETLLNSLLLWIHSCFHLSQP